MSLVPDGNGMAERPVAFLLHGGPGIAQFFLQSNSAAEVRDTAQLVDIAHHGSGRSRSCDPATCDLENIIEDVEALRQYRNPPSPAPMPFADALLLPRATLGDDRFDIFG